jgi:hypothetical protein
MKSLMVCRQKLYQPWTLYRNGVWYMFPKFNFWQRWRFKSVGKRKFSETSPGTNAGCRVVCRDHNFIYWQVYIWAIEFRWHSLGICYLKSLMTELRSSWMECCSILLSDPRELHRENINGVSSAYWSAPPKVTTLPDIRESPHISSPVTETSPLHTLNSCIRALHAQVFTKFYSIP